MNSERIADAVAAAETAVAALGELPVDTMLAPELLDMIAGIARIARLLPGTERAALARLGELGTEAFGGGRLGLILADRLRITPADAGRRMHEAADLTHPTALNGEPLPIRLPHTSAAERRGDIGPGHVKVIRDFSHHLPAAVGPADRARAEEHLVELSTRMRPDEVKRCAQRIAAHLNPDDAFSERDRARKRFFHLKPQDVDMMRSGSFCVEPELGAYLETIFAALAAPGMCLPEDAEPTVAGVPDPDAVSRDTRTPGQRRHDVLNVLCRDTLASGRLGSHRGLPVTVIATATVRQLQDHAGVATTGGGSLLPMRELIRMAGRTLPYLAIFDDHSGRPLHLGRARRLASVDQRIALHATDRGCTFPGCPSGASVCETQHLREWSEGGNTDIDNLTLVCPTYHRMIGTDGRRWRTRRNAEGRTQWIAPHHVDPSGRPRVNAYHHPADRPPAVASSKPP